MELTDDELKRISVFMKDHYGIVLDHKRVLVSGRLEPKLNRMGFETFDQYIRLVEKDPHGEEAQNMVNILTTNHTYFMREQIHFDYLKNVILPRLKTTEEKRKDIRIWSAAASSGEEAYCIVMTLKDFFGIDAENWDTKVLATDVSTRALNIGTKGIYPAEKTDMLPESWLRRYFKDLQDGTVQVKPEYRNEVIFRTFNLMEPLPFKRPFHVIFLRNVMIYFDEKTKAQLVKKMLDFLEPGGYLFTGLTETIDKSDPRLEYVQPAIYRRK